jgi:hypothetical protein
MKYLYGRIKLTGPSIKAARTNEGAFIRAVESEMKGLTTDLKSSLNRQLYGDASGALTVCGTTSASTSVVVVSTAKLRVGMVIDVLVTADGTTSTGAVIIYYEFDNFCYKWSCNYNRQYIQCVYNWF